MVQAEDYVFRDGRLVGNFDGLYRAVEAPWNQTRAHHKADTRRQIAVLLCERLRSHAELGQVHKVLEIGCGLGFLTDHLRELGFETVGIDVSREAVEIAHRENPWSTFLVRSFEDPSIFADFDPDIVIMSEVTWYVLDSLETVLGRLRAHAKGRSRATYLVHLLATYAPGVQKYGTEYFTDLDGILDYFKLEYLEAGRIISPREDDPLAQGTYFLARVPG